MIDTNWKLNQQNRITFVITDTNGDNLPGLTDTFTLLISKNGGAFSASSGTKSEIANGWYSYLSTAEEADTVGPLSIYITAVGADEQNLEYVVEQRNGESVEHIYPVTSGGVPVEGVEVWFYADATLGSLVWYGNTDVFGVARDANDNLPRLDPGTYYVKVQKAGYIPDEAVDIEVVA